MSSIELRICMHMLIFDFKAIGPGKRGGYRGGIIKNHQKTTSKGGSTTPYIPPFKRAIMIYFKGGMGMHLPALVVQWLRICSMGSNKV